MEGLRRFQGSIVAVCVLALGRGRIPAHDVGQVIVVPNVFVLAHGPRAN